MSVGSINAMDLFLNASGKMNRSMDIVKVGCGTHKDKKKYDRKNKNWKKES